MMENKEPLYAQLIKYYRNGLAEQVHFGLVIHMNKNGIINKIGEDNNYKFYHRSCMKPLQASVSIDLNIDLTQQELALCCASHTGDEMHRKIVLSILSKYNFIPDNLLCAPHSPLSKIEQENLIKTGKSPDKIHNNCSGKHALMLAVCKEKGFSVDEYNNLNHPLSQLIIDNVCRLCETDKNNIVISKDGCTLPVIATSLETLGRGFLNLFTNPKYKKITQAFLRYPYLIGGDYRLDSEIINAAHNLIAKVGAGGLCVVVNLDKEECLIVKIADSNMEARAFATINSLLQLNWLDKKNIESNQISKLYYNKIQSQDNEVLGDITTCFNILR